MLLYKKLVLPLYDTIVSELSRAVDYDWIVKQRGFIHFDHTTCPSLVTWLAEQNLEVTEQWIIVVPPKFSTQLHVDYFNPRPLFRSSLNIPIYNCEQSRTEFYRSPGLGLETAHKNTTHSDGIKFIAYSVEDAVYIDQYCLDSAYILNTQVPHRVVNDSQHSRICLSLRFARERGELWS